MLPDLHIGFSRGRSGGLVFLSLSEFSTVYCDPHKGFGIVNKAEIDVFPELSWIVSGLKFILFLSFSLSLSPSYSPTTATFWPERRKAEPKDSQGWGAGIGNRVLLFGEPEC